MMKNLLIIGAVWPEPLTTAAGNRMLQLIHIFLKNDYNIKFACAASKTEYTFNFQKLAVTPVVIELNNSSFDDFIKHASPDLVIFDRFTTEEQYGWRVAEHCPDVLRILDTEDLHFLRKAREEGYKKQVPVTTELLKRNLAKREIASIYRCDLTLIISSFEMNLLTETFKIDPSLLVYIPFLTDRMNDQILRSYPPFNERSGFMTIGNFKHEPNWSAVLFLKKNSWPLIRKSLPDAKIHIYGAYMPKKVTDLHKPKEGFLVEGWTPDSADVFKKARVCLAPIQFGAGLKGKLIDAMKFGTPSVTTSIGAEGMTEDLPWNGSITDDPTKFAEKAIELYTREDLWKKAQLNGVHIINNYYLKDEYSIKLMNIIQHIQKKLSGHRLENFIGQMLMHHTINSTKYMSKWIEEKNNNKKDEPR